MAKIEVTVVPVTINEQYSYTWQPLEDRSLEETIIEETNLGIIKVYAQELVKKYESQNIEALIMLRIVGGRAPNGFKHWKAVSGAILSDPQHKWSHRIAA